MATSWFLKRRDTTLKNTNIKKNQGINYFHNLNLKIEYIEQKHSTIFLQKTTTFSLYLRSWRKTRFSVPSPSDAFPVVFVCVCVYLLHSQEM